MHVAIAYLIGLSVRNNVFLFLYSASENIHHPLVEIGLDVFATLRRLHQFINFASFCMTAINIQIKFDRGCTVWKNLLFVV